MAETLFASQLECIIDRGGDCNGDHRGLQAADKQYHQQFEQWPQQENLSILLSFFEIPLLLLANWPTAHSRREVSWRFQQ